MPDETPTVVVMPDADEPAPPEPVVHFYGDDVPVQLQFVVPDAPNWSPREYTVWEHTFSPPSLTIYMPPGVEFVRADGDGKVFVRGTLVDSDPEVYRALRAFLNLPEWAKP
jgi:hypothetical protein